MRKTLVDSNGLVVNAIEADDSFQPPEGLVFGPDAANIGDTVLADGTVQKPPVETPEPEPPTLDEQLLKLFLTLPDAEQKQYVALVGTVSVWIDKGRLDLAKGLIAGLTVSPEAADVQKQMLELFG